MLNEDYCDFETAKLLKEKGFDENCAALYDLRNGEFHEKQTGYVFNNSQWDNFITAQTLQMAMKWLREVHRIDIIIEITDPSVKNRKYYCMIWDGNNHSHILDLFNSYEDAVEAAIKYCLKKFLNNYGNN